jgi:AcrR family transcriptional regulator
MSTRVWRRSGTPAGPRADGRTALLEAGVRAIAQRGTRGLRVEEVAREAGVSTSLIYHHFGDRTTFLTSALEHIASWATANYRQSGDGDARVALCRSLVNEINDRDEIRMHSAAWQELRDSAVFDEEFRPTIRRITDEWTGDIARLVARSQVEGRVDARLDPDETAQRPAAVVEGYSGRWRSGQISTTRARARLGSAVSALLPKPGGGPCT